MCEFTKDTSNEFFEALSSSEVINNDRGLAGIIIRAERHDQAVMENNNKIEFVYHSCPTSDP